DTLDASIYLKLKETLKETRLSAMNELVWELRRVKDETELGYIKKAANITSEGIKRAVEVIKPGIREYEVAAEIEYAMRKLGSQGVAFETIVASGPRSAFPHGGCTGKKIEKGELIVLDLGAKYENYRADITRTLFIGKPPEKQARIYETVQKAQQKAFESLGGGVKVKDADGIARRIIQAAGYGEYFVHRLGHGIGLDTHEPPTLGSEAEDVLKVGNVVTVEPGIYIEGFGGVRIEDTVRIRKDGAERLTSATYDWSV
nr:M24 family metallopeptidase [Candidatus Bathyarchaeota archaeon]